MNMTRRYVNTDDAPPPLPPDMIDGFARAMGVQVKTEDDEMPPAYTL